MMRFYLLSLVLLFVFSCQTAPELMPLVDPKPIGDPELPYCDGYVSKAHCDDGDSTLFSGLLCLAGRDDGCRTVEDSQDEAGRFWRSPRRKDGNLGKHNSFSRDMALGVLAYLVAERDKRAAIRWWEWIEANRPCLIKFGGRCLAYGWPRYCRDDTDSRCTITPTMMGAMYRVWKYLGLTPPRYMVNSKAAAIVKPNRTGYPLHLYGVHELLKQKMGYQPDYGAIRYMLKLDPNNLLFIYLYEGKSPLFQSLYAKYCPGYLGDRDQWAWERDSRQQPWLDSMVWDCMFIESI